MVRRLASVTPAKRRDPVPESLRPGLVQDWLGAAELAALPAALLPDEAVGLRIVAWGRMKKARRQWCADKGIDIRRSRQIFPADGRFPELGKLAERVRADAAAHRSW